MSFKNCKIAGRNVNSNEYHALKTVPRGDPQFVMSPSAINLFASIPPSKWIKGYERKDTAAKVWGNVIDTRLLTPDQFDKKYIAAPEFYTSTMMVCPYCKSESVSSMSCRKCGEIREEKTVQKPWNYQSDER